MALALGASLPWAIGLGVTVLVVLGLCSSGSDPVVVATSPVATAASATPSLPQRPAVLPPILRLPPRPPVPVPQSILRPSPLRSLRPSSVESVPIDGACAMPGIGAGIVARLRASGIRTLGDVTLRRLARVRGIGPVRSGQLLAWAAARRSGARIPSTYQ